MLVDGKVKMSKDVVVDKGKFITFENHYKIIDVNMSDDGEEEEKSDSEVPQPARPAEADIDTPSHVIPTTSQPSHSRQDSDGSGGDENGRRVRSRIEEETFQR
jgi:hypothetical protein